MKSIHIKIRNVAEVVKYNNIINYGFGNGFLQLKKKNGAILYIVKDDISSFKVLQSNKLEKINESINVEEYMELFRKWWIGKQ